MDIASPLGQLEAAAAGLTILCQGLPPADQASQHYKINKQQSLPR
jgi:hypothetical protein